MKDNLVRLVCLLLLLSVVAPAPAGAEPRLVPSSNMGRSTALIPGWMAPVFDPPPPPGVIEPALARALAEADSDGIVRAIVVLREQSAPDPEAALGVSEVQAREHLVTSLQALADRSQAPVRAYLEGAQASGGVESYTPFWIFNGLAVRARPDVLRALAARSDVRTLRLDHYRQWVTGSDFDPVDGGREAPADPEWGVSQIRADQVWASLQISGTGAVVAGMDSGVDWLHPDLQVNYRGYNPHGVHSHFSNWFDPVEDTLYPVDDNGHGTHTIGSVVGRNGIGVAPGAQWIGVRILNSAGYGYDSWIHAGFQWLLAPGGDPGNAPDVVNCSWGNDNGGMTTFQDDIRALRAAGILPIFSNGNNGPLEGTVGSPASLPEAFAVGASDRLDQVASFSSRGPSPWGQVRPHVVAPGVDIRSALPGGQYGNLNGTSMAAPHASGIAALLHSISPTLNITHTTYAITSTAVHLSDTVPNNDSGWGRVDAFDAALAIAHPGLVTGTVSRAGDGTTVAGAAVVAEPVWGGGAARTTTDERGDYLLVLSPDFYDLTASAFGYATSTISGVEVVTDATTRVDLSLTQRPTGTLQARAFDAGSGDPITVTLSVMDTPLEATASAYTFTLPDGTFVVRARRLGYRVVTETVAITAGDATQVELVLPSAPSILLVDSGAWYYDSQMQYFRQALDDLAYAYDEWTIADLPEDVPEPADVASYDLLVWSAPWDAPGYIGAEDVITHHLSSGGGLFLSGQDVGYLDGGGAGWTYSPYYEEYLKADLASDSSGIWTLMGTADGFLAGVTVTIEGPGGADNQQYPDVVRVADPDSAASIMSYQQDGCGGMGIGTCLDYRAVYLSFGFEAINDRTDRREVMGRGLEWLAADPPVVAIQLTPASHTGIVPPGGTVTHAVRVRHIGQAETDVFTLSLQGDTWATELETPSLVLGSCTSATIAVTVTIPPTAAWDAQDVVTLTARSSLSPSVVSTAVLTTKAPAPVLLVDDDRWYDQGGLYRATLGAAGLPFDYWSTTPGGGPPSEDLRRYPMVVWFTGYDWYRPVTVEEEQDLADYVRRGGRLFLSSQDFLYYHHESSFTQRDLGVLAYTEDVEPTLARGVPEEPVGGGLGPWDLEYPFLNWSDGVEPAPGTGVSFRDQGDRAIALARREESRATAFFSFPFETLPEQVRPDVMERVVGWISWLGGSTFGADRGAVSPGDRLTYTVALRNDGPTTVTASFSNTLPATLTLVPGSLTGPGVHSAPDLISWQGPLAARSAVTSTYQVTVADGLSAGTSVVNTARLGLEDQQIHFPRDVVVRVGTPDLSPSAVWSAPSTPRPGGAVTCTLALVNAGPADAPTATMTNTLPVQATVDPGSLAWFGGGAVEELTRTIRWTGALSASHRVTLTYRLTLPWNPTLRPLYNLVSLEDGTGGRWERAMWHVLDPVRVYLPTVIRD